MIYCIVCMQMQLKHPTIKLPDGYTEKVRLLITIFQQPILMFRYYLKVYIDVRQMREHLLLSRKVHVLYVIIIANSVELDRNKVTTNKHTLTYLHKEHDTV